MTNDRASAPALEGVTVIDCGQVVAGPFIAMVLGDFGADVIKIEHPVGGDPIRNFGRSNKGVPLYWNQLSRNKRSVSLALNQPAGQELFRRIVEASRADVVIESFRPGTLERWGLGYEVLRAINPALVLVRVSGYGQTGPYRERPGFGTLAEAMSGLAHLTGHPDGPPTLPPLALADSVAALYGVIGTLLALRVRDRTGSGQVVDVGLLESVFSLLGSKFTEYDQLGLTPGRNGNRATTSAPRNLYPTGDGKWIAIAAATQGIVDRLFGAIGHPELVGDPRFANNSLRLQNVEQLDEVISTWTLGLTRDAVVEWLVEAQVPVAPVSELPDLAEDPQLNEREAIISVRHPILGEVRMPGVFPKLVDSPGEVRQPGGDHGDANDAIFRDLLGLSEQRIQELMDQKVI